MFDVTQESTDLQKTLSLGEIIKSGETASSIPVNVQLTNNCGERTLLFSMSMNTFHGRSIVASGPNAEGAVAQRPLDTKHAFGLAKYILAGLVRSILVQYKKRGESAPKFLLQMQGILGARPLVAIQPIVCNIRGINADTPDISFRPRIDNGETVAFTLLLAISKLLYVIDGQHRKKAIDILFKFLESVIQDRKFPTKSTENLLSPLSGYVDTDMASVFKKCHEATYQCTVQIESHLGLDIYQERQIFHDLNNLGKNVDPSLSLEFDSANPINSFIKTQLIDNDSMFKWAIVGNEEKEKRLEKNFLSRKDFATISAVLFLGKTSINDINPGKISPLESMALKFWTAIDSIPHIGEPEAQKKTVAAMPVILKALAKTAYMLSSGKNRDDNQLELFLNAIPKIDYSHQNPLWRYFNLSDDEQIREGLSGVKDYLAEGAEGRFATKLLSAWNPETRQVKYSTAHNDVFPVLGDLIRYQMRLPPRKHRAAIVKK